MAAVSTFTGAAVSGVATGAFVSYVEYTSTVTISATTEGTANTIVTAASFAADGFTPYWIEFFAPMVQPANGLNFTVVIVLYDGTSLGFFAQVTSPGSPGAGFVQSPVLIKRRLVPSAGVHSYSIRGYEAGGNGAITAGAGGVSAWLPGYVSITKAA